MLLCTPLLFSHLNDSKKEFDWAIQTECLYNPSDMPGLVSCFCFDTIAFKVLPLLKLNQPKQNQDNCAYDLKPIEMSFGRCLPKAKRIQRVCCTVGPWKYISDLKQWSICWAHWMAIKCTAETIWFFSTCTHRSHVIMKSLTDILFKQLHIMGLHKGLVWFLNQDVLLEDTQDPEVQCRGSPGIWVTCLLEGLRWLCINSHYHIGMLCPPWVKWIAKTFTPPL